jgi:hypothetical protein
MSSETASIAAVIRTAGHITDLDVLALRRAIWGSNRPVGRDMAVLFLALDREIKDRAPTWPALYLDALTDFFLDGQAEPAIDGQAGELLIREITADGRAEDATELRLLLTLVARAVRCPAAIVHLARERLLASVQASDAPLFGKGVRRPSAIDEDDIEAIRRLVYGQGGTSGLRVDEAEALWLAALDRATAQAQNAAAWPETFEGYGHVPAADPRHGRAARCCRRRLDPGPSQRRQRVDTQWQGACGLSPTRGHNL